MAKRGRKPGGPKTGGRKPNGRNKVTLTIKELAEPYGIEALEVLVNLMRKDKSSMVRVAAAREVLDRAFGKAMQPLTANGDGNLIIEIIRFGTTVIEHEQHPPVQEALPAPSGDT